jgi:hypothetical protein
MANTFLKKQCGVRGERPATQAMRLAMRLTRLVQDTLEMLALEMLTAFLRAMDMTEVPSSLNSTSEWKLSGRWDYTSRLTPAQAHCPHTPCKSRI